MATAAVSNASGTTGGWVASGTARMEDGDSNPPSPTTPKATAATLYPATSPTGTHLAGPAIVVTSQTPSTRQASPARSAQGDPQQPGVSVSVSVSSSGSTVTDPPKRAQTPIDAIPYQHPPGPLPSSLVGGKRAWGSNFWVTLIDPRVRPISHTTIEVYLTITRLTKLSTLTQRRE